jgi:hypothetical protein
VRHAAARSSPRHARTPPRYTSNTAAAREELLARDWDASDVRPYLDLVEAGDYAADAPTIRLSGGSTAMAGLAVSLQTDFVPGVEFDRLQATVDDTRSFELETDASDSYVRPRPVTTYRGLWQAVATWRSRCGKARGRSPRDASRSSSAAVAS